MGEMKPLQTGIIYGGRYGGNIIMRTASSEKFEVIDLSLFGKDKCWTSELSGIQVEIVEAEITVTIK